MRQLVVYLDTSVASAYFDRRDRARMLTTREFWRRLEGYEVLISDLVIGEIRQIPDENRRRTVEDLLREFALVVIDEEVRALADRYLRVGIFGSTSSADALHVAAGTVAGADVIVSWNFQHMVKVRTVQRVSAANLDLGYRGIDIRSPLEL
jgi:predicted nucleic acid-binding protein